MEKKQSKNDLISENYFVTQDESTVTSEFIQRNCDDNWLIQKSIFIISKNRLTGVPLNNPQKVYNFIQLLWQKNQTK
jgi:hypothetical protein